MNQNLAISSHRLDWIYETMMCKLFTRHLNTNCNKYSCISSILVTSFLVRLRLATSGEMDDSPLRSLYRYYQQWWVTGWQLQSMGDTWSRIWRLIERYCPYLVTIRGLENQRRRVFT